MALDSASPSSIHPPLHLFLPTQCAPGLMLGSGDTGVKETEVSMWNTEEERTSGQLFAKAALKCQGGTGVSPWDQGDGVAV